MPSTSRLGKLAVPLPFASNRPASWRPAGEDGDHEWVTKSEYSEGLDRFVTLHSVPLEFLVPIVAPERFINSACYRASIGDLARGSADMRNFSQPKMRGISELI